MNLPGMPPPQSAAGFACLLLLALCSCAAQLAGSDSVAEQARTRPQSIDHTQLQRSGRSPFRAPRSFNTRDVDPGTAILHVNLREYRSEAVVADDGTAYIVLGDEYPRSSGERKDLLAIGPQGRLDWHFPLGNYTRARVNLDNFGTPYVMHGRIISKLDHAGHVLDSIKLDTINSNFVLGNEGQLLAASDRYDIRVIDSTGVTRARVDNPGSYGLIEFRVWPELAGLWLQDPDLHPGLLVFGNGHLLISFRDDLYYLNGKGEEIWRQPVPTGRICGIACQDNRIVLTTIDGTVQSLDLNGRLCWLTTLPPKVSSRPCIDSKGNVIAANGDGYIISISPVGSCNWITSLNDASTFPGDNQFSFHYKVMLSADDQVLVTNTDGKLYCLDSTGQVRFVTQVAPLKECYAAFGPAGRIHAFCGSEYVIIGEV
ncbi:MAG: PQQ-binding-like beta-propeller repeat protein [bacterium]